MRNVLFCLLILSPLARAACPSGQPKNENVLMEIERTWARSLEQQDVQALGCILATEFQDADPQGALFNRDATLAKAGVRRSIHHDLSETDAHIFGDAGYIRGLATAVGPQGNVVAKVRFTDIYVYRDGRWQAVAAHESMIPAPQR